MKKIIFSAAIVSSLILGACGSEEADQDKDKKENAESHSNADSDQKETTTEKADEEVDGPLTEPGQWTMDGETKVTLVKIKELNQTYDVGPMKVTIDSVKLLKNENITEELKEAVSSTFGKEIGDTLSTIQFMYKVENTSADDIMFHAFNTVTTDTKAQIDAMYNMGTTTDAGTYLGQVVVDGLMVLPYLNEDIENVNKITVTTGDVWYNNEATKIADSSKIEIDLN